jgi:hypothetical protein
MSACCFTVLSRHCEQCLAPQVWVLALGVLAVPAADCAHELACALAGAGSSHGGVRIVPSSAPPHTHRDACRDQHPLWRSRRRCRCRVGDWGRRRCRSLECARRAIFKSSSRESWRRQRVSPNSSRPCSDVHPATVFINSPLALTELLFASPAQEAATTTTPSPRRIWRT